MDSHVSTDDECFAEAARWYARLRDDAGDSTRHAFETWLAADPAHVLAMDEARMLFDQLHQPALAEARRAALPVPRRRPSMLRFGAAAGLLLVALAGGLWLTRNAPHTASTMAGESRVIRLDDGSEITLATDSAVDVDMTGHLRRIHLVRGEALFHVTRDPSRPFIVDSTYGSARVLGTVFDVRLRDGQTRVGVVEGRVGVQGASGGDEVLSAGEAADLATRGVTRLTDTPVAAMTAWTRGQLVFYRAPLHQVMDEVGRYRRGTVLVRGDALRALPVSGSFDVRDPDRAVDAIVASLKLHRLRAGPWLTIVY